MLHGLFSGCGDSGVDYHVIVSLFSAISPVQPMGLRKRSLLPCAVLSIFQFPPSPPSHRKYTRYNVQIPSPSVLNICYLFF